MCVQERPDTDCVHIEGSLYLPAEGGIVGSGVLSAIFAAGVLLGSDMLTAACAAGAVLGSETTLALFAAGALLGSETISAGLPRSVGFVNLPAKVPFTQPRRDFVL